MLKIYNADFRTKRLLKKVYGACLKYFSQPDVFLVEIEIVGKDEIRTINAGTRGVDKVTDVLSFPGLEINKNLPVKKEDFIEDIDFDSGRLILGETVLCMDKILEQSKEYGTTPEREAGYLFLHSLLHLFGYDHEDEEDKKEMRRKEEDIMLSLGLGKYNERAIRPDEG